MVNWTRFDPSAYDITFNDRKLAVRDIDRYDVMEVLWNGIQVIRDKHYPERYRVRGRTDAGRALELIAVVGDKQKIRFITGWPI